MKHLVLLNPRRKRRKHRGSRKLYGAALAARQAKMGKLKVRRHKVRKNPMATKSRKHSAAMRAKISRAVKASMRNRRSNPTSSRAIVARPAVRRAIRRTRKAYRSIRRSSRRRGSFLSLRGIGGGGIRSLLSKDNLMIAGGAVGASAATNYVMSKWGASLPGMANPYVKIAYQVGIPYAGSMLVRKFNGKLADGLVIGGLANGIGSLISMFTTPAAAPVTTPATTGQYLNRMGRMPQPVAGGVGQYLGESAFRGAWDSPN